MYAIVKAGGRQEKVAVGDVLLIDRVNQAPGVSINLPALLVVDGAAVTTDSKALAGFTVTAEILEEIKGEKIHILRYKNKTGYRRRQGFRAKRTRIKVTEISKGE